MSTDPATVAAVDPQALETDALAALEAATTTDEVELVRVEYLGRKSALKLALREVRDRETGMTLNALRERLEAAIDGREEELRRVELDRRLTEERVDVTMPGTPVARGQLHLITQIRREFEDLFLGLGYTVVDGREVETTRYNFDALNFPPGHPTRSPQQTLFLDGDTVMRTETSPSRSARWRRRSRRSTSSRPGASTAAIHRTRRIHRLSTRWKGSRSTRGSRSPTCSGRSTT